MTNDSNGETATERPDYVISRMRYFDGEFLATQDFIDEQDYHVDRQVRHQAQLHAPGIMEGLEVTPGSDVSVHVSYGSALDADGNQILLSNEAGDARGTCEVFFASNPDLPDDGDYFVYIEFSESYSGEGSTHFTQASNDLLHIDTAIPDGAVPLARVRVVDQAIDAIDTDYFSSSEPTQKYAGLRLPGRDSRGNAYAATVRVENVNPNPNGYYPHDSGSNPPDYKVLLTASGGLEVEAEAGSALLEVTGDGINASVPLNAQNNLVVTGTAMVKDMLTANAMLAVGTKKAPAYHLEVWNNLDPDADKPLFYVQDENNGIHAYSKTTIGSNGHVSIGKDYSGGKPDHNLEVWDGDTELIVVTSGGVNIDSTVPLNANGGLAVTGTAAVSGMMSIGTANAPSNPLEVYDSGSKELLAVKSSEIDIDSSVTLNAKGGLVVGSDASVSGTLTALEYTFPGDATPGDTSNPPVIRARALPENQGGGSERSELILFSQNDTGGATWGPDAITLRAPVLRFQTYPSAVTGMDDVNGCNDRLYVDWQGNVAIGNSGAFPNEVSDPLEVYDSDSSKLLSVASSGVNAKVQLNAEKGLVVTGGTASVSEMLTLKGGLTVHEGMTLFGKSHIFGSIEPVYLTPKNTYHDDDDNDKPVNKIEYASIKALSDGFVMVVFGVSDDDQKGHVNGYVIDANGTDLIINSASVDYDANVILNSFTMPVMCDEEWRIVTVADGKDHNMPKKLTVYWRPIGQQDS